MCLLGRHQAGAPRSTIRACPYLYKIQSELGKILLFCNVIYMYVRIRPIGFANVAAVSVVYFDIVRGIVTVVFYHVIHLCHGILGVPALLSD